MAEQQRILVQNRKARHEYEILEVFEAGIVLTGTEIKSIRNRDVSLQDSYAQVKNGEVWLHNMHVNPYKQGSYMNQDPRRVRKLLLQKGQIRKLIGRVSEKGLTLVPLSVYLKGPVAKMELALVRGRKTYDKRQHLAEKFAKREVAQRMKRAKFHE